MTAKQAKLPSAFKKVAQVVMHVSPFTADERDAMQRVTLALFISETRGHIPGLFRQVDDGPIVEIGTSYQALAKAITTELDEEKKRTPVTTGSFWRDAAANTGKE